MKMNKNVEMALSYGAFRFSKGTDFETGKVIYGMWYLGKLVGEYNKFEEMEKDYYKMIEEV